MRGEGRWAQTVEDENDGGGGGDDDDVEPGGECERDEYATEQAIRKRPSADTQVSRPSIANQFRSGLRAKGRSGLVGLG